MSNVNGTLMYPEECAGCINYDHLHIGPLVEILKIKKDEQYERRAANVEQIFVMDGEILLSIGVYSCIHVQKGKLFLLPPGGCMFVRGVEEATLFICRIEGLISLCDSFPLEKLMEYRPREGFTVLTVKPPLVGHLSDFMDFVEMGLLCKRYLRERINGIGFALRALYTKEELGALFSPVANADMIFINRIFAKLKRNIDVGNLVVGSGLNRKTFDMKFMKIMGKTPKRFLNDYKTESILHDLACSPMSIKELSFEYGFPTVVRFSQFCTKYLGAPPGRIRKRNKKDIKEK